MDRKAFETLEFDKIRQAACEFAVSEIGRETLLLDKTATDFEAVRDAIEETAAAESLYKAVGHTPVDSFPDIRNTVKSLPAVFALDMGELLSVAQCLKASRKIRECILSGKESLLEKYTPLLVSKEYAENEIARCIISEEEMADKASPELARIRRDIKLTEDRVKDKINQYIRGSMQKYLQEPLYTVRSGRYVVPVKAEYKSYVPGLIHDQSASGQTLYIEPNSVVELGNQYKSLLLEEQKEIQRILAGLTALLAPEANALYTALVILGKLDALFAKAALAAKMNAVKPVFNERGYLHLIRARHPLLPEKTVVPIDVWIGDTFRTLIVTGPNTGGKTVSLKTVGLFCLMAQTGYFIPADVGTELPVFTDIFADIGDEQSIEQSLSTFSAHMKNLVFILKQAGEGSLVLLDELGAGTDPLEGAALAQAILEYLKNAGATTFATTHYSEIKAFALATPGMENASMEFDVDRLQPTYRMFIGIPGKSNAFEISTRLGLAADIVARAKDFLTTNDITFEDVLSKAEQSRKAAEQALWQANETLQKAKAEENRLSAEKQKWEQSAAAIKAKAREEAKEIIASAREEAETVIGELRKTKNLDSRAVERNATAAKARLRELTAKLTDAGIAEPEYEGQITHAVVGNVYYSDKLQRNVTVLQEQDAKGYVSVQAGSIKTKLPVSGLSAVTAPAKERVRTSSGSGLNTQQIKAELDIRGYTVDDACLEMDRYIDMCLMHGRQEFNIIHGKGTGALRAGVQQYLKKDKRVKSIRMGAYGEGDAGVTVVTLKNG